MDDKKTLTRPLVFVLESVVADGEEGRREGGEGKGLVGRGESERILVSSSS